LVEKGEVKKKYAQYRWKREKIRVLIENRPKNSSLAMPTFTIDLIYLKSLRNSGKMGSKFVVQGGIQNRWSEFFETP